MQISAIAFSRYNYCSFLNKEAPESIQVSLDDGIDHFNDLNGGVVFANL
jgi:hypothetical protein